MIDNFIEIMEQKYTSNIHISRYWKLIRFRLNNPPDASNVTEKHHILPVSLFPEYSDDRYNICVLRAREHYLAHYFLAKGTNSRSMWFAFNQMKRIIPSDSKSCILYEKNRHRISNAISESNSGNVMTEENKENMSRLTKGTVVVRNKNGLCFRVSVNDPMYVSGDLVYYRNGYKHSEETKIKISANNGVKGKRMYYDPNYPENSGYFYGNESPDGWVHGESTITKKKISNTMKDMLWYHDPKTKKNYRFNKNSSVPDGLTKGRYFEKNHGFDAANEKTNVVDLIDRVCKKVYNVEEHHAPQSGTSSQNTKIIVYDGKIFSSWTSFNKHAITKGVHVSKKDIEMGDSFFVKKPHHNNNANVHEFRKRFMGLGLGDIGIVVHPLTEFNLNDHVGKEIVWN